MKLGIDPPKGVLLFGPPGTGKTLCARAVANRTDACFIRVIGSELVQKYVGEVCVGGVSAVGCVGGVSAVGCVGGVSAVGWVGGVSAVGWVGAASAVGWVGGVSAVGWVGGVSAVGWVRAASAVGEAGVRLPLRHHPGPLIRDIPHMAPSMGYHRRRFGIQLVELVQILRISPCLLKNLIAPTCCGFQWGWNQLTQ